MVLFFKSKSPPTHTHTHTHQSVQKTMSKLCCDSLVFSRIDNIYILVTSRYRIHLNNTWSQSWSVEINASCKDLELSHQEQGTGKSPAQNVAITTGFVCKTKVGDTVPWQSCLTPDCRVFPIPVADSGGGGACQTSCKVENKPRGLHTQSNLPRVTVPSLPTAKLTFQHR